MPSAGQHHEPSRARAPNPNPSGVAPGQSILIVDDDLGTRETFEAILSAAGFRVSSAASSAEALGILKVIAFDVVLLDLWLGAINTFPLLEHIRGMERATPVVMISGFGDVRSTANSFKLGAADFVEKPLYEEQLLDVVTRNLGRKPCLDETGRYNRLE
jgi:DNA-binding NtrC family response regulator